MEERQAKTYDQDIAWEVPEYQKHERSKSWYVIMIIVAIALMIFAVLSNNYLFLGIIVLGAFVLYLNDRNEPMLISIVLGDEGITVGSRFYDYDEIKDFSIVYKPHLAVKTVYFEFKSALKQRLSIPLIDQDPIMVREALLRYLPEDLERINPPTSEGLAKLLKL